MDKFKMWVMVDVKGKVNGVNALRQYVLFLCFIYQRVARKVSVSWSLLIVHCLFLTKSMVFLPRKRLLFSSKTQILLPSCKIQGERTSRRC